MKRLPFFLLLFLVLGACHRVSRTVPYDSEHFRLENDGMKYRGEVFTGNLLHESRASRRVTPYRDGKIHGEEIEVFKDSGRIARRMRYENGKKVGTHEGFYPDGAPRFRSNYRDGVYDGPSIQWYKNGQMYTYTLYKKGKVVGHKLWRESGRIYSNYVYKDGRKLGLDGGKLCFSTKDAEEKI